MKAVAYLGPPGTFTAEALANVGELAGFAFVAYGSISEAIQSLESGEVTFAFVPIENSIEGSVPETLDQLLFHSELLIVRETVLDIHLQLLGKSMVPLNQIERVVSYPHASGQCRNWLIKNIPEALVLAANSTSDAAKQVSVDESGKMVAVAPALAGEIYGLKVIADKIEDHKDNQTRFVLLSKDGIPKPSGHDRTTITCFQHADRPGSLHEILGQFSARGINLTKLESRPTKEGLGQYCFLVEFEGHISDAVIADCLRDLHSDLAKVKFLGSYPNYLDNGAELRALAAKSWTEADEWMKRLQSKVGTGSFLP
ncbi:MAG: prephenate dehydratase [Acidimicrobiales bacterium]|nr:prephenate dehydratase [Acidimicrobiales bacterium]